MNMNICRNYFSNIISHINSAICIILIILIYKRLKIRTFYSFFQLRLLPFLYIFYNTLTGISVLEFKHSIIRKCTFRPSIIIPCFCICCSSSLTFFSFFRFSFLFAFIRISLSTLCIRIFTP